MHSAPATMLPSVTGSKLLRRKADHVTPGTPAGRGRGAWSLRHVSRWPGIVFPLKAWMLGVTHAGHSDCSGCSAVQHSCPLLTREHSKRHKHHVCDAVLQAAGSGGQAGWADRRGRQGLAGWHAAFAGVCFRHAVRPSTKHTATAQQQQPKVEQILRRPLVKVTTCRKARSRLQQSSLRLHFEPVFQLSLTRWPQRPRCRTGRQ